MTDTTLPAKFEEEIGSVADIPIPDLDARPVCDWDDREQCQEDNNLRAMYGGLALRAYAERVGMLTNEPPETAFCDLLNDLRHLADALDLDFDDMAGRDYNYAAELAGTF